MKHLFLAAIKILSVLAIAVAVFCFVIATAQYSESLKYDIRLPDGTEYSGATNVHYYPNRIEFRHGGRHYTAYGATGSRRVDE